MLKKDLAHISIEGPEFVFYLKCNSPYKICTLLSGTYIESRIVWISLIVEVLFCFPIPFVFSRRRGECGKFRSSFCWFFFLSCPYLYSLTFQQVKVTFAEYIPSKKQGFILCGDTMSVFYIEGLKCPLYHLYLSYHKVDKIRIYQRS